MMIADTIRESIEVKQKMLENSTLHEVIDKMAQLCVQTFRSDGKVLFCGNGGSAADAQHLSAELSGRFKMDRPPLFAEALHVNTSFVTAVANDYHYDKVFARMVAAMGRKGDVLVALSTSGNSANMLEAVQKAKEIGMIVLGFSGATGGKMAAHCDHILLVPSNDTARIQEAHIMVGHIVCDIIERTIFNSENVSG